MKISEKMENYTKNGKSQNKLKNPTKNVKFQQNCIKKLKTTENF